MLWSTTRCAEPCGVRVREIDEQFLSPEVHMGAREGRMAQLGHAASCGAVASFSTSFWRLQCSHAVSAARRGIIEHNISENAMASCHVCVTQGHHQA